MPTFLSLPAVHQEIEKMTAAGDILIGETILSQETTEGLVDGHLVPKELVVTLKADNPEDLTEEAIRNAIPAAVKVIRNGPVIRCHGKPASCRQPGYRWAGCEACGI